VRVGNALENKENARPWEGEYRDDYATESERVAAKLARKESLNIKLALRPDRQELINRYVTFSYRTYIPLKLYSQRGRYLKYSSGVYQNDFETLYYIRGR
jgi:hypothetical protein